MAAKGKTEAKATKTKPTPPKIEKPEYGVDQLAKELSIEAASVRVRLRSADGLKEKYKTGRAWDFGNKKNLQAVAKQLKSVSAKEAA